MKKLLTISMLLSTLFVGPALKAATKQLWPSYMSVPSTWAARYGTVQDKTRFDKYFYVSPDRQIDEQYIVKDKTLRGNNILKAYRLLMTLPSYNDETRPMNEGEAKYAVFWSGSDFLRTQYPDPFAWKIEQNKYEALVDQVLDPVITPPE